MKTLEQFLTKRPSYTKCGNAVISKYSGISENTVAKFKKTEMFKTIFNNYTNK